MGSPKPTRETASRDHSLDDDEILERYIAARHRESGSAFNMPDRLASYVDGAELFVCNAVDAYFVPFIEKGGRVSFGEPIVDGDDAA